MALKITADRRHGMEHIAEVFKIATDVFLSLPARRHLGHAIVEAYFSGMHLVSVFAHGEDGRRF